MVDEFLGNFPKMVADQLRSRVISQQIVSRSRENKVQSFISNMSYIIHLLNQANESIKEVKCDDDPFVFGN